MTRKSLPQVSPQAAGLGQPTIMDRALAASHGVAYVHLSAFAIDVDRVFNVSEDDERLPFGWEVFLVLCYVLDRVDSREEAGRSLLEDSALHILAADPSQPQLGSVLAFALHAGVERGLIDRSLAQAFSSWRAAPKQLRRALDQLFRAPRESLTHAALHCLGTSMSPPLSPPTLMALEAMGRGEWPEPPSGHSPSEHSSNEPASGEHSSNQPASGEHSSNEPASGEPS